MARRRHSGHSGHSRTTTRVPLNDQVLPAALTDPLQPDESPGAARFASTIRLTRNDPPAA